jgi:peptidoglycan/LPS O-acetylase OafA/YrhL
MMQADRRALPPDLTSYDLLKALAIILVVIDHVGYYFFPDTLVLRILGRFCVPVWFFLIGYARARTVPFSWWAGGGLLVLANMAAGEYILPLSILFTLGLTRLAIDGVMARALRSHETLAGVFFVLFFLALPSSLLVEYGTIGVLFAMLGFLRRHKDALPLHPLVLALFVLAVTAAYILHQLLLLPPVPHGLLMVFIAGMAPLSFILLTFAPRTYPGFGKLIRIPLQFLGRGTLEIFVVHLLVFRLAATLLDPARFGLFDFQVAPPGFLAFFTMPGVV